MSLNHIVRQYLFKNTKPSKYVENPWAPFRNGLPFCTQKCKIVCDQPQKHKVAPFQPSRITRITDTRLPKQSG